MNRFAFLWSNPNHAASVFAGVLPLIWGWRNDRVLKARAGLLVFDLIELAVWVMLGATASRGGFAGAICALLFFAAAASSRHRGGKIWLDKELCMFVLVRALVVVTLVASTNLLQRFQRMLGGDDSVLNRLKLWQGGLKLIYASPIQGWGLGNSGTAYIKWIQSESDHLQYGGMVNSYLHIAVEFGLISLSIYLMLLVVPSYVAFRITRSSQSDSAWAGVICSCMVSYLTTSFFSTLWLYPGVVFMPVMCLVAIGTLFYDYSKSGQLNIRNIVRYCMQACCIINLFVLLLYIISMRIVKQDTWFVRRTGESVIVCNRDVRQSSVAIAIVSDERVLGKYSGRAVRSMFHKLSDRLNSVEVFDGELPRNEVQAVLLCIIGAKSQYLQQISCSGAKVLILPSRILEEEIKRDDRSRATYILFSNCRELQSKAYWRRYARLVYCKTGIIAGVGQDLGDRFDSVVEELLDKGNQWIPSF